MADIILFLEDWKKFPNAIAHTTTTNTSWVHLASVYKAMGIKNCYFHLQLHTPMLAGVDPHAPNLSPEIMLAIKVECSFNPFYFFREVLRLPVGDLGIRFEANRANISVIWSFLVSIDYALVMPRQIGKSVSGDGLLIWLSRYYYRDTSLLLYTKDRGLRAETMERLKKTTKLLPPWVHPDTKNDSDNTESYECFEYGNYVRCKVGQAQEETAKGLGRGSYSPFMQTEEGPFTPNYHLSLPAIMQATGAARENCEKAKLYYGNLHVTTAGELNTDEGLYCYDFYNSGMFWSEHIFDCRNREEAHEMVRRHSAEDRLLLYGVFNHRQVGKDDNWLRTRLALAKSTKAKMLMDYFNVWWTGGGDNTAINEELMEIIRGSLKEPSFTHTSTEQFLLNWYISKADKICSINETYLVGGIDTSNALGRDANALIVSDVRDLGVTASSIISEANLMRYAKYLATLLIETPNLTLIIENKSSAMAIMDAICLELLKAGINPFTRMFNRIVDEHTKRQEDYYLISNLLKYNIRVQESICTKYKEYFGFNTTGNSREFLYSTVLNDAIGSSGQYIRDQRLISELGALIIDKNGRIDHRNKSHDDSVIAWLLSQWFVRFGKNLQFYGISKNKCLSLIAEGGALLTPEELSKKQKISALYAEIDELKKLLTQAKSAVEYLRYERTLSYKVELAKEYGDTTLNFDSLIASIKDHKQNNKAIKASTILSRYYGK